MLKKFIFILLVSIATSSVFAQGTPGGGTPGGGEPGGPLDPGTGDPAPEGAGAVPVDAGLGFLLAGGVAYGAKKAYHYKKNKVKSEK
jgi:hypothetical protein